MKSRVKILLHAWNNPHFFFDNGTTLILEHAKQGFIGDALKTFDEMLEPETCIFKVETTPLLVFADNAGPHALVYLRLCLLEDASGCCTPRWIF